MTTVTIHKPRLHAAQAQIRAERRRFNVLNCGRRTGKTTLLVDLLTDEIGLSWPCAYFAPTYKNVEEVWQAVKRITVDVTTRINEQQHRLEYITGGVLELWSLDKPNAMRGRKYKRAAIDEAAQIRDLEQSWSEVIRPTLADLRGEADFASTPYGLNYFYTLFQRGQDAAYPEWNSWHLPTAANPYMPRDEIEAMRIDMSDRRYLQEVEAEFMTSEGAVFRRVHECATAVPQERAIAGHQYVMGIDWAREVDFTVITVIDSTLGAQVAIDRFNKVDYTLQVGRVLAMRDRFPGARILAEENSIGNPMISALRQAGVAVHPFVTTNASKADAVDALALAFERGAVKILNDPIQLGELLAYEGTKLPSGLIRYSAPEGMHDDTVMALMIAWQHAARAGVTIEWL